jgi:multiple sugar transport system permease protein
MEKNTPKEILEAVVFVLPLAIFLLLFTLYPVAGTVVTGFFRDTTFYKREFIHFDNFALLLNDRGFFQSVQFTLLFIAASVPLELLLGLAFALLVHEKLPFRGFLRVSLLIPWAVPAAVSGRVWELIYNYSYGLANFCLFKMGLTKAPVNWLGSEGGAFFALVLADVWKTTPFVSIILLAGLQTIPEELKRQAAVDGASFFRRFTRLTLPLLKPVMVVALLFRTIDALRIFDVVYVITGGGPGGSTTSLSIYAYRFFVSGDFGYGSAISVFLFLLALALSILYLRLSRFKEAVA